MKLAKLEGTKIVNISVGNDLLEGWVDLTDIEAALPKAQGSEVIIAIGGHIIGGAYVRWPDIEDLKAYKLDELNQRANEALEPIVSGYGDQEQKLWFKLEEAARAFATDPSTPPDLITNYANKSGLTEQQVADRIIAKADASASLSGIIAGEITALRDAINNETDVDVLANLKIKILGV